MVWVWVGMCTNEQYTFTVVIIFSWLHNHDSVICALLVWQHYDNKSAPKLAKSVKCNR